MFPAIARYITRPPNAVITVCSNRGRLGFYANIDIILGQCRVHQVIDGATIISAKSHLKEKEKWYFTVPPRPRAKTTF